MNLGTKCLLDAQLGVPPKRSKSKVKTQLLVWAALAGAQPCAGLAAETLTYTTQHLHDRQRLSVPH
jgi:hypothetical protein